MGRSGIGTVSASSRQYDPEWRYPQVYHALTGASGTRADRYASTATSPRCSALRDGSGRCAITSSAGWGNGGRSASPRRAEEKGVYPRHLRPGSPTKLPARRSYGVYYIPIISSPARQRARNGPFQRPSGCRRVYEDPGWRRPNGSATPIPAGAAGPYQRLRACGDMRTAARRRGR